MSAKRKPTIPTSRSHTDRILNRTVEPLGFNQDALRMAQNGNIRVVDDRWEKRRVARRDFSVFDQLATNGRTRTDPAGNEVIYPPSLTKNMQVAGNNMFCLYMVWKGLGGASDSEDVGFVDRGPKSPESGKDRMKQAGDEYMRITGKMKTVNARLLNAICHDMSISDGSMIDTKSNRPVVRWRQVVRNTLNITDRDCQREAVVRLCKELVAVTMGEM